MPRQPPRYIDPELQFEDLVEQVGEYKGAPAPGQPPVSPWAALSVGKTLGKRVVTRWSGSADARAATFVDMLTISADDKYAHQLCLTLCPPKLVLGSAAMAALANTQAITGERDNVELMLPELFSSGITPEIILPECVAIVEWGIGGIGQVVEADFSNGLCLNLSSAFLRVRGAISNLGQPNSSPGAIVLASFIGPGNAKYNNAQRTVKTQEFGSTGAGFDESRVHPVPRFAKQASLLFQSVAFATSPKPWPAQGYIRFWRNTTGPANMSNYISQHFFSDLQRTPVVVPNDAYYFSVFNTTVNPGVGGVGTEARVVFDLAV